MTERQRLPADERKQQILAAAFHYARKVGYDNLTRDGVAAYANVSTGQVTRIFGGVEKLRDEVIGHAVKAVEDGDESKQTLSIVARGMLINSKSVRNANRAIKQKAMAAAL